VVQKKIGGSPMLVASLYQSFATLTTREQGRDQFARTRQSEAL
jgi:hypothetical protein